MLFSTCKKNSLSRIGTVSFLLQSASVCGPLRPWHSEVPPEHVATNVSSNRVEKYTRHPEKLRFIIDSSFIIVELDAFLT
jgi:hypothetical protein